MDWISLLPGIVVPLVSLLVLMQRHQRNADWNELCAAWKRGAQELGFHFGPGEQPGQLKIFGKLGDLDIVVDTSSDLRINTPLIEVTRFQVFTAGQIPEAISIERVQPDGLQIPTRWRRVETGDDELDSRVLVWGSEAHAAALLDRVRRKLLLGWVARSGAVIENSNVFYVESGHIKDPSMLIDRARRLVRFAKALCLPEATIPQRLLVNAKREENVVMRRRAFRALFAEYRHAPEAEKAISLGLADQDARVRLYAAMALGDAGAETIATIARSDETPLEERRYAFDHLVRTLPLDRARTLVAEALDRDRPEIQRTIIRAVRDRRRAELVPELVGVRCDRLDVDTAQVLAEALGLLGGTESELMLLTFLAHEYHALKLCAARALGRVGTVRAVEPLLLYTTLFTTHDLKDAARSAVKQIQSRIGEVDCGRLSIVESAANQGALSVAGEGGTLSFSGDGGALALAEPQEA